MHELIESFQACIVFVYLKLSCLFIFTGTEHSLQIFIYVRSSYKDVDIPEVNLADFVFENALEYSDNPALVCGITGNQYTYGTSRKLSIAFSSAMRRLGAQRGDVVVFTLPNMP